MNDLRLVEAAVADIAWMLGEAPPRLSLTVAPGGVDNADGLDWQRGVMAAGGRTWWVVAGDEIVGLCCFKAPPSAGEVEVGYRIGPAREGRGFATRGLASLLAATRWAGELRAVRAETLADNHGSIAVLRKNGFVEVGRRAHSHLGAMIDWRLDLAEAQVVDREALPSALAPEGPER